MKFFVDTVSDILNLLTPDGLNKTRIDHSATLLLYLKDSCSSWGYLNDSWGDLNDGRLILCN